MLEEVLKSINSNLERIAKSQEDILTYMREPIDVSASDVQEALKFLANTEVKKVTEPVIQQTNATVMAQTQIPAPAVQPIQKPEPVQQATAIPTTPVQESFTQEQLAVAMSNAVSAGKMNVIQGILQQFNAQALTQINPTDYNKVATMLKEAGVNV